MDTLLIAVTGLSLAIAAAMSLVVLKLLGEDRRRSEARIAALLEAAGTPRVAEGDRPPHYGGRPPLYGGRPPLYGAAHPGAANSAAPNPRDSQHTGVAARSRVQDREAPHEGAPYRSAGEAPHQGAPYRAADLPLRAAPATAELFVEPERRPSWGPRIALAAGVMAVLLGAGFTLLGPGAPIGSGAAAAPPREGPAYPPAPLELLTLRHTAGAGSLTVSGLVQNPRGGAARRRVTAAVYALDASGEIVATNRAPIDLTTFGPGEESPFVVIVPVRGTVARYRVGFRSDDGDVIAHVDRRTGADALAHK